MLFDFVIGFWYIDNIIWGQSMGKYKAYCINTICISNCNSIHVISKNRYCYDDKYQLKQSTDQMRYKIHGKDHVVATGIIDHCTHTDQIKMDQSSYTWELNFSKIVPIHNNKYRYAFEKACSDLNYDVIMLLKTIKKYVKEIKKHDKTTQ